MNQDWCFYCSQPGHRSHACPTFKEQYERKAMHAVTQRPGHFFGHLKPDSFDHRDLHYAAHGPKVAVLPRTTNNAARWPDRFDQGDLGSCTGNAESMAAQVLRGAPYVPLSRLMIYWGERDIEGTVNQDAGAQIRDGLKFMQKTGACPENEWPYVVSKFKLKPPQRCYTDAAGHKIGSYLRLHTQDDILHAMASGLPVVMGIAVYESFESDEVAKTGVVPMPKKGEKLLGYHAVCGADYDLDTGMATVANSWGMDWGQHGFFKIPLGFLTNPKLTTDLWAVQR